MRFPKLADVIALVKAFESNPFGSLVLLLLVLVAALMTWAVRH